METESVGNITSLLRAAREGQPTAVNRLFSYVYDELRAIARNRIQNSGNWTAEPTTLVNEAYLRLYSREPPAWEDRHHFFWTAARAMRDILVERARREKAEKHGGGRTRIPMQDDIAPSPESPDLLDLHDALTELEAAHARVAEIVHLKFFAGLTREQIAETLNVSPSTVWQDWSFACVWLRRRLEKGLPADEKSAPSPK